MRHIYSFSFVIAILLLAGNGCALSPVRLWQRLTNHPSVKPVVMERQAVMPPAVLGSSVALKIGTKAVYGNGLIVTLKQINDSRCPLGTQCVWQGELAPVLLLSGGGLASETELLLGTERGLTGRVGDHVVTLSDVTDNSVVLVADRQDAAAAKYADMIRVTSPAAGQAVTSPLVIAGEARGTWYFEASFPVRLLDSDGKVLASAPAQAQGDWMTEEFVPFQVSLAFDQSASPTGTLVLQRDNPSGLSQNDAEIRIPVAFAAAAAAQRSVKLYYYDPARDGDAQGNVMCSRQGVVSVARSIPVTQTPIQDAVRLLLQGGLTDEERGRGLTTEFPLPGVELKGASLKDGVLALEFADPNNRTSGGSCRAGILWYQIEATAKQFPEVDSVRFLPEELFQP